MYRTGQSFRIDATAASDPAAMTLFMQGRPLEGGRAGSTEPEGAGEAMLDYRRWWAESQPEVAWADAETRGAYVVDVSQGYWRERSFLLTFELDEDAARFALLFLGLDQPACVAVARSVIATRSQARAGRR